MKDIYEKIDRYIEENSENIVTDLTALINIPSVHGESGKYPFGEDVDRLLSYAAEYYQKNGYGMKLSGSRKYALLKTGEDKPRNIGVFAHGDVVPVNEAEWTVTKPFEAKVKDGFLFGRGSEDDKSSIVTTLYALKALDAAGYKLQNGLTVFVGGNEESGMADIIEFAEREKMPDVSVVPDCAYPYTDGEKGIIRLDLKSRKVLSQILDINGGKSYNTVLGEVDVLFEKGSPLALETVLRGEDVTEEDAVQVNVKGISAHAALPYGSVNAFGKATDILLGTEALCSNDREILSFPNKILSDYVGKQLGIAGKDIFGDVTAVCGMVYVDNGHLVFTLDIRYGISFNGEDIIEKIRTEADKNGYDMSVVRLSPGFLLEDAPGIARCITEPFEHFTGRKNAKPFKNSGGTYARHLKNAYAIGTSALGERPKHEKSDLGLPVGHGAVHQSDECISVEGLVNNAKVIAAIIYELDRSI